MSAPIVVVRGAGSIGARHARAFAHPSVGARVVVWPVRPGRRADPALEGLEIAEGDGVYERVRPAGVIVATDTGRHGTDTVEAIARGAHVLCEKPLTPVFGGARPIAAAAAEHRRVVRVACNLRFQAALARFRELLPRIGRVHAVRIECQSFLPDWRPGTDYRTGYAARADEGGVLRDLVHEIDYALWLYGPPRELFARVENEGRLGIASDETADLLWKVDHGPTVSIRLDYLSRPTRRRMTACAEDGTLEWDGVLGTVRLAGPGVPVTEETVAQERDEMMRAQARAFLAVLRGEATGPMATLEDGARAVAICDAARRASATGRAERVEGEGMP